MRHPLSRPKWTLPEGGTSAAMTRAAVMARVQENLDRAGAPSWSDLNGDRWREVFSAEDSAELAATIFERFRLEEGRKYFAGCEVALRETPERYTLRSELQLSVEPSEFAPASSATATTSSRPTTSPEQSSSVREVSEVDRLMSDGVPEGTIAVIDDAGGTLTAPILPDFDAVVLPRRERAQPPRDHRAGVRRAGADGRAADASAGDRRAHHRRSTPRRPRASRPTSARTSCRAREIRPGAGAA